MDEPRRRQGHARKVAFSAYKFHGCVVCGLQLKACLQVAHLNHRSYDDTPDNLALLCPTHHGMHDCGLLPTAIIKLLRDRWEETMGEPDHSARMKDAGRKAAATRKHRAAARKAAATRLRRREAAMPPALDP